MEEIIKDIYLKTTLLIYKTTLDLNKIFMSGLIILIGYFFHLDVDWYFYILPVSGVFLICLHFQLYTNWFFILKEIAFLASVQKDNIKNLEGYHKLISDISLNFDELSNSSELKKYRTAWEEYYCDFKDKNNKIHSIINKSKYLIALICIAEYLIWAVTFLSVFIYINHLKWHLAQISTSFILLLILLIMHRNRFKIYFYELYAIVEVYTNTKDKYLDNINNQTQKP